MTKKDYEKIADAIASIPKEYRLGMATTFLPILQKDNKRFRVDIFLKRALEEENDE